jgi:SAM-dependent methyltransferase
VISADPPRLHDLRGHPEAGGGWRVAEPEGRIDWRLGYSDVIDSDSAEFAVMSGHVAQVFVEETAWLDALRNLHRALVPGGMLAFESRNPAARKWEAWTRELTLRTVETPDGAVEFWHETVAVDLPRVSYDTLTRNLRTGEATANRDVLAFRGERALRAALERSGFATDHVYGDWDRTEPTSASPELIVIARKP